MTIDSVHDRAVIDGPQRQIDDRLQREAFAEYVALLSEAQGYAAYLGFSDDHLALLMIESRVKKRDGGNHDQ